MASAYHKANPEKRLAAVKNNRERFPDRAKAVDRKMHRRKQFRTFEVTESDLEKALVMQGGVCAICQAAEVHLNGGRQVHIDHCHKTNKFRGILCLKCNVVLGMAEDDPARLIRAAVYVQNHSSNLTERT